MYATKRRMITIAIRHKKFSIIVSPDTSNVRITGDYESDRMTNWSWLHLSVHYTDSNCKPHSGFRIAGLRDDILPKTVSTTTFDVTRVKQSNTLW